MGDKLRHLPLPITQAVGRDAARSGDAEGHLSSPRQGQAVARNMTPMTALVSPRCPAIENADRLSVAVALVDEIVRPEAYSVSSSQHPPSSEGCQLLMAGAARW